MTTWKVTRKETLRTRSGTEQKSPREQRGAVREPKGTQTTQHTQQKNTSQFLLDGGNASGRRDNETLPLCFCP